MCHVNKVLGLVSNVKTLSILIDQFFSRPIISEWSLSGHFSLFVVQIRCSYALKNKYV